MCSSDLPDQVRRFKVVVLRPLWVALLATAGLLAVGGHWLWLGGALLGVFYLGVIGSNLHPLQSAGDLATEPLTGPVALQEALLLPAQIKAPLVGHACTRVGLLVGVASGVVLYSALELPWYIGLVGVLLSTPVTVAFLKLFFVER